MSKQYPSSKCPDWITANASESEFTQIIQRLVKSSESSSIALERRRQKRFPYPRLVTLTPVADHELVPVADSIVVVGKNLAHTGLDFYHSQPLPHRRLIVTFEDLSHEMHMLLHVTWCRFLRPGWYDSGGRFTQLVEPNRQPLGSDSVVLEV